MRFFENLFEVSHTKKISKLNRFLIGLLLIEIFLVPMIFVVRNLITQSGALIDPNKWSIATWILSIISFISGLVSVILSVKGLNHSLGRKSLFAINIVVGAFGLLLLSGLVFLPRMYILF